MLALCLWTLLGLQGQGTGRPVALVLTVKGAVEAKPVEGDAHRVRVRSLIYAGDRVGVAAGGGLSFVFLATGYRFQVKPGREVTIGARTATPEDSVVPLGRVTGVVADALRNVQPVDRGGRSAAAVFRSADQSPGSAKAFPAVEPIEGAAVLADRPTFAWPAVPEVKSYRVRVWVAGADPPRLLWTAETGATRMHYSEKTEPLPRGRKIRWAVSDSEGRTVVESQFLVAAEREAKVLRDVERLARTGDAADLLLAGVTLEANGVYDGAIRLAERLTELWPDEPTVRESLEQLRRRAGKAGPSR
jgi:hypothetical protein